MKIELPDEIVTFMQELAKEIKTQDNRMTASPYFYVVQSRSPLIAPDGYGDGDDTYYDEDRGEGHTREQWEEILKDEQEDSDDPEVDIDDFIDNCKVFGMHLIDIEENIFLTEKGYHKHMELNGHNYRHHKETYSYVKHAFRNPELDMLLKAIRAFDVPEINKGAV